MGSSKDLIGALLVGIGIFATWAFTIPGYQAASTVNAVIDEKEVELAKKQEILERITGLKREYENRSEEIERLSQVVPTKKSIQEIIAMVESAGSVNGLTIISVAATGGVSTNTNVPYDRVNFEVEFSGNYPAFYGFLDTIEKNLRLLDVVAFDISPPSGEGVAASLAIKLKMEGYVLKENYVPPQTQPTTEE
jgi:Tfp pilus assembly protein PilO